MSNPLLYRLRRAIRLDPDSPLVPPGLGGEGGGLVSAPATTSITFAEARITQYDPLTITGPTTLTFSGTAKGEARMTVIANGTNVPTVVGASELASSFGYKNVAGVRNYLGAAYDGDQRTFAWAQLAVADAPTPAPPAPTPPAPTPPAPAPSVAPSAPTSFAAGSSTTTSQPLSWAAPATGNPASYTYSIAYRVNGSGAFPSPQLTGLTGTSTTVSGLTAGTSYDYQITATNSAGTGPAATITAQSTAAAAPPPAQGGGEDALTTAYRSKLVAASIAPNETHMAAADTFLKGLRTNGLEAKLTTLNLAIQDTAAASLISVVGPNALLLGGTTFDPALGWATTGGSSSVLDTQVIPQGGAAGVGAYLRTAQVAENVARTLIGTGTVTDQYRIIANRNPPIASGSANGHTSAIMGLSTNNSTGTATANMTAGCYHAERRGATDFTLYRNGTPLSSNTTDANAAAPATSSYTLFAQNSAGGTSPTANTYLASGSRVSAYWTDNGTMSDAQIATFNTLMQAFQTAMGRAV